jgi:hypothetical protein
MNRTRTIRTLRSTSVWFCAVALTILLLAGNLQSSVLASSTASSSAAISRSPVLCQCPVVTGSIVTSRLDNIGATAVTLDNFVAHGAGRKTRQQVVSGLEHEALTIHQLVFQNLNWRNV